MKMNYKTFPRWACWIGLLVVSGFAASSVDAGFPEGSGTSDSGNQRERLSLNNDWLFSFGSPGDLGYSRYLNKGGALGIQGIDFKGKEKVPVRLPHDWAVGLPPSQEAWDVSAFTPVGLRFPETSIGWYKRKFALPETDAGKTLWLEFDGIFRNAQIWVNHTLVARQEGGYERARFDITDLVKPGKANELWVRVDAAQHEGWWYEGVGIYRNAWLVKTAAVAVAPDGVFVHPEFPGNVPGPEVDVPVELTLMNRGEAGCVAEIGCEIQDGQGVCIATATRSLAIAGRATGSAHADLKVHAPVLWSPETPVLHTLITRVRVQGRVVDETRTPFGFRTARFDPQQGFLLNGKPTLLKGACCLLRILRFWAYH